MLHETRIGGNNRASAATPIELHRTSSTSDLGIDRKQDIRARYQSRLSRQSRLGGNPTERGGLRMLRLDYYALCVGSLPVIPD